MKKTVLIFTATLALTTGCSKAATDDNEGTDSIANVSQTAMAEANSQATASETSGSVGFAAAIGIDEGKRGDLVDPADAVHTSATTCTYSASRSVCSSSSDTLAWSGCTVDGGLATMTGGWTETFSGPNATACSVPVTTTNSVTRTSTGSTITFANGASIATDTAGGTAWDNTVIPNTGTSVSNTGGTRTITINGTHKVGKGPRGKTIFDHFLTTPTPLTVTGLRSTSNRQITAGTMKVYHNLLKYSAAVTFNGVQWGSSACCYPTTGSLTTVLTGSVTGNTTLTFSGTCGSATYTDMSGASSNITLNQCN